MNHINASTNKRLQRISSSIFPVLFTLIIIASLSFNNNNNLLHTNALKLTSLGSSIDRSKNTNDAGSAQQTDDLENLDYSSVACSASEDDDGSSSSLATCTSTYGVDNSFPIHHSFDPVNNPVGSINNPFGTGKQSYYNHFMHGCRDKYQPDGWKCDGSEEERIEMNLRQPGSMFVSCSHVILYVL